MLREKAEVDRHVYHILSKCKSTKETNLKGFEIAKLYADIKEFKLAKKFLDSYLKTKNDSVLALTLLARVNESLDNVSESLQAYKSALKLSLSDKNIISHALSLALESNLPVTELEFWSGIAQKNFPNGKLAFAFKEKSLLSKNAGHESLLGLLKSQLEIDQSDTDICLRYLNCLIKSENYRESISHFLKCLKQGFHIDSSAWFRCLWDMLEKTNTENLMHGSNEETIYLLRVISLMELLRTSSSTCCLSDMRNYLESLYVSINRLSNFRRDEFVVLKSLAICWIYFYTGVFAQRFFIESVGNANISLIHQLYACASILVPPKIPKNLSYLSAKYWSHLLRNTLMNRIQASYLVNQYLPDNSASNKLCSWRETMDQLCKGLGFASVTQSKSDTEIPNSIQPVNLTEQCDTKSILATLDASLLDSDWLDLILWISAHEYCDSDLKSDSNHPDLILSDTRINFISQLISTLFPNLNSHNSPYPFPSELVQEDKTESIELCQTDVLCFLLACFLHMALRSLSKSPKQVTPSKSAKNVGIGSDILSLPLCLIPSTTLSNSSQRSLWSAILSVAGDKTTDIREPTRVRTILQQGLHQLRLSIPSAATNEPSKRFSIPFLFRLARSLTRLRNIDSTKLVDQELWADGYWRAALHYQTSDSVPTRQSMRHSTFLSNSGLADKNTSLQELKDSGSPLQYFPFTLPTDYNLWLGLSSQTISPDHFYNWGLEFCLLHLRKLFHTGGNKFTPNLKTKLTFLLRILDREYSNIGKKSYELAASFLDQVGQNYESWNQKNFMGYVGDIDMLYFSSPGIGDSSMGRHYLAIARERKDVTNNESNDANFNQPYAVEFPGMNASFLSKSTPKINTFQSTQLKSDAFENRGSLANTALDDVHNLLLTPIRLPPVPATSAAGMQMCNSDLPRITTDHAPTPNLQSELNELVSPVTCDPQEPSTYQSEVMQLQLRLVAQSQDLLMSTFMNNWQTLVNGLTCQLAETQIELSRSRQLNEQLSKQLSETTQKLSDAMNKFSEFQQQFSQQPKPQNPVNMDNLIQSASGLISTPIQELSQSIADLRHWLPEGMAAAAVAAVNARSVQMTNISPAKQTPIVPMMPIYAPSVYTHQPSANPRSVYQIPPQGPMIMNSFPVMTDFRQFRPPVASSTDTSHPTDYYYPQDDYRMSASLHMPGVLTLSRVSESSNWVGAPQMHSVPFYSPASYGQINLTNSYQSKPDLESDQTVAGRGFVHLTKSPTSTGFFTGSGTGLPGQTVAPSTTTANQESKVLLPTPKGANVSETNAVFTIGQNPVFTPTSSKSTELTVEKSTQDKGEKPPLNYTFGSGFKLSSQANDPRVSMWSAKDFSEKFEGKDELSKIQFKTPEIQNEFSRSFTNSVTKSDPDSSTGTSASQSETPPGKPNFSTSYAPKPGDWECSTCMLQNKSTATHCAACKTAKPGQKTAQTVTSVTKSEDSLLSKFAPKPGSWECPNCLLLHDCPVMKCPACNTLKPGATSADVDSSSQSASTASLFGSFKLGASGGFVFGQPKPSTTTIEAQSNTPSKSLFSFVAAGTGGSAIKSPASLTSTPNQQTMTTANFIFGTPTLSAALSNSTTPATPTPFSFGLKPKSNETTAKLGSDLGAALNFSQRPSSQTPFNFNFNTPLSTKSNIQSSESFPSGDDRHDDDKVELVDDSKLAFKPVLDVMPEKVEVRTGEENDEVIFCQRAKLYRWDGSNWRERGTGDLKLLKSRTTNLVRCLMRRDHVLKVCCNHLITVGMNLKPMSSSGAANAWSWWALDFSEHQADQTPDKKGDKPQPEASEPGSGKHETLAARFKHVEHAKTFHDLFVKAVEEAEQRSKLSKSDQEPNVDLDQNEDDTDSDVVVIEKPLQVTKDQITRARQLKLPDEFYSFENGNISGESEKLTTTEEAEEDALLQAAIDSSLNKSEKTTPCSKNQDSPDSCKPSAEVSDKTSSTFNKVASDQQVSTTQPSTPFSGIFGNLGKLATPTSTISPSSAGYVPQGRGLLDFSALTAGLSQDSKPLWGSGSTPGNTTASGWSTTSQPLFAKSILATKPKDDSTNEGTAEEEEHDPHYDPIITLPKLVETKSGEEEELCLFLGRCRVYRFDDKAWKERGVGEIKVLVRPRTKPVDISTGSREVVPPNVTLPEILRARLLMRRDQVLKLCVNQPISPELPVFKPMGPSAGANSMCWVGEDYSEGSACRETFAIKFKLESDAQEFKNAVARAQSLLKS